MLLASDNKGRCETRPSFRFAGFWNSANQTPETLPNPPGEISVIAALGKGLSSFLFLLYWLRSSLLYGTCVWCLAIFAGSPVSDFENPLVDALCRGVACVLRIHGTCGAACCYGVEDVARHARGDACRAKSVVHRI